MSERANPVLQDMSPLMMARFFRDFAYSLEEEVRKAQV